MGSYSRLPHLWRGPNGYLYIVYSDRGRWLRKSTRQKKVAAAEIVLREFVEQDGERRTSVAKQTLGAAAEGWVTAKQQEGAVSEKSLRAYQLTAKRVADATIGNLRLGEIEPRDVREYVEQLRRRKVKPSALAREVLHLRMLFRWLQRQEAVRENPAELVETPKAPHGRRPAVTLAQFVALRAAAAGDLESAEVETDRREAQLLLDLLDVLWLSGLRSIEAVRLQWRDVDLDARTWRIRSPANKGGDQVLPLHPELVPVLRRRMLETAAEEGPFALEWHVRNAWRRFKGRHKEWTGWSLHSLRHGFVTRVRAAAGDAAASHLARHKSKAMTEHYSHFDVETFRDAIQNI